VAIALAGYLSWPREAAANAPAAEPNLLSVAAPAAAAGDSEVQKLKKERFAAALEELKLGARFLNQGSWDTTALYAVLETGERMVDCYSSVVPAAADRVALLTDYVEYTKFIENILQNRFEAGSLRKQDLLRGKWYRLDAECRLVVAKDQK